MTATLLHFPFPVAVITSFAARDVFGCHQGRHMSSIMFGQAGRHGPVIDWMACTELSSSPRKPPARSSSDRPISGNAS